MIDVDRPLAGIVVVDLLADPLAGVTRTYVELGAEVVRVEPLGRFGGVLPASQEGLRWLAANIGKTLIETDDAATLAALFDRADMIVRGLPSEPLSQAVDTLLRAERRDATVVMTVSMFGVGTSYQDWQATDAVLHALTGELSRSGLDGRPPLLPPGELGLQCGMAQAAYAGMAALYAAQATGRAGGVDVSMLDAAMQALDPAFAISGSATLGRPASDLPPGRPVRGVQYPILRCADGDVRLCLLAPRQWRAMFDWMGRPAAFAGTEFDNTAVRQGSIDLREALSAFLRDKDRVALEREGMARGVPIAGILTLEECLATPHVSARGMIGSFALPDGTAVRLPDGVIEIDGRRMTAIDAMPHVAARRQPRSRLAAIASGLPLAGLKVLDLGVIVVGGEQSRLLADLGADVVKVESAAFPDGTRHSYLPTGLSVGFAAGHRNKRSLGLDLRQTDGKALFRRLASKADVILSNFKPGTMEALGFGAAALAALNPRLILVESSAFGATGPWAPRMGYGPLVRAAAGLTARWRYPDDPESYSDSVTIYPDHVGARYGVIAALALLLRRLRTGRGGCAALSQMEVMISHFAADIAGASIDGVPDASSAGPNGVYRADGDDEWCVVSVRDNFDRRALRSVTGLAEPITRHDVAAWIAAQNADDAMRRLQSAGVPAARMLRVAELPTFGYYRERAFFRTDRHPHIDQPIVTERRHAVFETIVEPTARPAPLMGQDSATVLHDWLRLGAAEIEQAMSAGVIQPISTAVQRLIDAGQGRSPPPRS